MKGAKPIYFSASTLSEFKAKREQIIQEYVTGKSKQDITFVELLNEWWTTVKLPRIKADSTRHTLESAFRNHVIPMFHPSKLARAIRYKDLQKCLDAVPPTASIGSPKRVMQCLKGACSYGVSQGYLETNYTYDLKYPICASPKQRSPLTAEQAHAVRDIAENSPSVALLYYTGMRLGEMIALTWEDIDFESNLIHVRRTVSFMTKTHAPVPEHTKTNAGNRHVPMPPELADILRPLNGDPQSPVVPATRGKRWRESTYFKWWADHVRSVKGLEEITPHWLRHNYATACYMARVPVTVTMVWLGHAKIGVTMDTYTHVKKILESKFRCDDYLYKTLKIVAEKLLASGLNFDFSNNI